MKELLLLNGLRLFGDSEWSGKPEFIVVMGGEERSEVKRVGEMRGEDRRGKV